MFNTILAQKKLALGLFLACGLSYAQKQEDVNAIKAMTGCYKVSFNFAETFSPNKDYEKTDSYHSRALEWITVADEKPGKVVLQHILVVNPEGEGKDAIVKHWRQDWLYQNTDFYTFDKENHWKFQSLPADAVKGQWTQVVYQVDDAPRYSASGTWIHADGKNYWEANADAPLPRREYTTRKDYNVLNRTNRQEIMPWGWLHFQDNTKILREDGKPDTIIAEEIGKEKYTKVDDARCLPAQKFWKEYAPLWAAVRQAWQTRLDQKKDLYTQPKTKDVHLYGPLMKLEPNQTKEAQDLVNRYILK
ncbi:DUF6607 family protein [Riemerella columbina]|uniref:DUF6607 family protein n=1 Tax=Riemerella columbina TaxID=103810 RepID=UPI00266EF387|nr:DUF6607 family protein [Riemerella columbina]WKS94664.1 hypothetical protein NYR17_06940 [Riemerella columbina]